MTTAKRLLSTAAIFTALASTSCADEPRATDDAERARVWDSAEMVAARLVMDEYFATSAEVTPEEAEDFWAQMEAMSAAELRFWLAKFYYERQGRAQIAATNDKMRRYKLDVAQADRRRSQNIHEQFRRSMNQGARLAQNRAEKSLDRTSRPHKDKGRYGRRRIWFGFRF